MAKRGQALVELANGLFAFALVVSALIGFGQCIVASLDLRRTVRAEAGRSAFGSNGGDGAFSSVKRTKAVSVSPLAADAVFGTQTVRMTEESHIPHMSLGGL